MKATTVVSARRVPWNKGKLTGQKPPLKLKEIYRRSRCPNVCPEFAP